MMPMTMVLIDGKLYGWYKKADIQLDEDLIPLTTDMCGPDTILRHKRNIATILSNLPEEHASQLSQGHIVHVELTRSRFLDIVTKIPIA